MMGHRSTRSCSSVASVHIISVVSEQARGDRLAKAQAQDAISTLEDLFAQESDLSCQSVIERGRPHEAIRSYAAETDIDLVVMGTHGRRGLSRALLGSVTERIIRLSNDPVLAVPPHAMGRERDGYERSSSRRTAVLLLLQQSSTG